jgi:hypothetical protein
VEALMSKCCGRCGCRRDRPVPGCGRRTRLNLDRQAFLPAIEQAEALAPLWDVPAEQSKTGVVVRTARIGRHPARPHYHGSHLPWQLSEQVEAFTRVSPPYRLGPSTALLAIGP